MEFHLKEWRDQQQLQESDQQPPSAKRPKLLFDTNPQQLLPSSAALPLFASEPSSKLSNLSAYITDSTTTPTKIPRMGSYFSLTQWQELELQALIFRHMLAGAVIPSELLNLVKKSLHNFPPPYYFPHHLQPGLMQSGYWGRAAMDPEPGRCRRTDGKKWRCSRDVVAGQKYCERHMHRGRNRSRKPVEAATTFTASTGASGNVANGIGVLKTNPNQVAAQPLAAISGGTHFPISEPSPSIDLLHLNHRTIKPGTENKGLLFQFPNDVSEDNKSDGQVLRHFFDDWPRSVQEPDNNTRSNVSLVTSTTTSLSISFPGDSSSEFSLKLSTGNNREDAATAGGSREDAETAGGSREDGNNEGDRPPLNWAAVWGTSQQVSSMGGPLAEALRSSGASKSSPTSVLHQPPRGSISQASYVSTCF